MAEEEVREFYNNQNRSFGLVPGRDQAEYYARILSFFQRCRINYALTHSPQISVTYLQQFWATAAYDCRDEPPVMRATVNNQEIQFSADTIRQALRLGTVEQEDGPVIFLAEFRMGAFTRMGYSGDVRKDQLSKSCVYGQWRLLMHVMIVCFSARRAGPDAMGSSIQSAMLSLVYNKPFSFSRMILYELEKQIRVVENNRFLAYGRFLMIIFKHLNPDLPDVPPLVQAGTVERRTLADCRTHNVRRPEKERPQETPLFGFLIDPAYQPPANDAWFEPPEQQQQQQPQQAPVQQPQVHVQQVEAQVQVQEPAVEQPVQQPGPVIKEQVQDVGDDFLQQLDMDLDRPGPSGTIHAEEGSSGIHNIPSSSSDGDNSCSGSEIVADSPQRLEPPTNTVGEKRKRDDYEADKDYQPGDSDDDGDDDVPPIRTRQRKRGGVVICEPPSQMPSATLTVTVPQPPPLTEPTTTTPLAITTSITTLSVATSDGSVGESSLGASMLPSSLVAPHFDPIFTTSTQSTTLPTPTTIHTTTKASPSIPVTTQPLPESHKFDVFDLDFSFDTSLPDRARIIQLERRVEELSSQMVIANQLINKLDQYTKVQQELQAKDRALIQTLLQQNAELMKQLQAQGENVTCKGDELRLKRRVDDPDNDHNRSAGIEPPSASTTLYAATTLIQLSRFM